MFSHDNCSLPPINEGDPKWSSKHGMDKDSLDKLDRWSNRVSSDQGTGYSFDASGQSQNAQQPQSGQSWGYTAPTTYGAGYTYYPQDQQQGTTATYVPEHVYHPQAQQQGAQGEGRSKQMKHKRCGECKESLLLDNYEEIEKRGKRCRAPECYGCAAWLMSEGGMRCSSCGHVMPAASFTRPEARWQGQCLGNCRGCREMTNRHHANFRARHGGER